MKLQREELLKKNIVVWLGAMLCCALWGSAFPCIKIGYELFQISADATGEQMLFAGCRFALAGVLAVIIGSIMSRKMLIPKKSSWSMIVKLCMMQTVMQYVFFYIGLANTTGVKASIIEGMNVFISILLASMVFKQERLTGVKVAGCIFGFFGVALVNLTSEGLDVSVKLTGGGFILISTVACAMSAVLIKEYSTRENPVILSGYQFMMGGTMLIVLGLSMGGRLNHITLAGLGLLFYMACISAIAYSLWGILLKYNPVSKVTVFGFMNPMFGVLLSALLLSGESGEAFSLKNLAALVLVCAGIYVVNRKQE